MTSPASPFKTTHGLDFLSAHWNHPFNTEGWQVFKIGTCNGQWISTSETYDILSVVNHQSGNGHFEDVLQWWKKEVSPTKVETIWRSVLRRNKY